MLYHILKLKNIPEPVFAHVYSCPRYECHFKEMVPNLEIAYIKAGDLTVEILGESFTAKEKSFLLLPHKYNFHTKTSNDEVHIHYTISAMVDANSVVVREIPENLEPDEICVPFCLDFCSETDHLITLLNNAILEYQNADKISKLKCSAIFTELLCDIARAAQRKSSLSFSKSQDVLDYRIKMYIEKNLNQKITLSDITEAIGKNANYLNQVFQKKNNMSIISYVNLMKMKKVAVLITSEKLTLKEAAKEVGIADTSYLSRLFKHKMGMTVSEFKTNSADFTFSLNDLNKIF